MCFSLMGCAWICVVFFSYQNGFCACLAVLSVEREIGNAGGERTDQMVQQSSCTEVKQGRRKCETQNEGQWCGTVRMDRKFIFSAWC